MAIKMTHAARAELTNIVRKRYPLKLLEEIRAVQANLVAIADGDTPPTAVAEPPDLSAFIAGLSSAWRAGEIRPTFSVGSEPRYLRSLQNVVQQDVTPLRSKNAAARVAATRPVVQTAPTMPAAQVPEQPQLIYAEPGTSAFHALEMVWPLACRRLEAFPNITATQLFEELCVQFPGRFHPWQVRRLMKRVKAWREDARARGVVIGSLKYRSIGKKPRGRGPGPQRFIDHWSEMLQCLEARPDQTAKELLVEFQARYPGIYDDTHLRTLRRRVSAWRREAIQRLICGMPDFTKDISSTVVP